MKQLTMTKVLTPLAALAFAFGVQAATVGLQSSDGFEAYTAGSSVTNATGWSFTAGNDGADDASAVTAYGEAAKPASLPDAFSAAGDNYLKLSTEDGMLFRNMDGDAGGSVDINAGLYVDTDVQFTITDPSDRPEVTGDDKFIVWLEADGADTNLCVWAREFTVANGEVSVTSNKVYKLASADIVPGEWHRLTVKALAAVGDTYKFPAFQVYLDGVQLAADTEYIVDSNGEVDFKTKVGESVVNSQLYFPAMANSLTSLSKVGFSGEGAIDNVAVTYAVPVFSANSAQVAFTFDEGLTGIGMSSLGQTITTSGDSVSVETNTSFVITLEGYNENAYTYTFTPSGNITYDPETRTVTVLGSGAATLAIVATAKDTVNVTFNWSDLNTAMDESVTENTGISFTVGADDVHNANIDEDTSMTIPNLKVGTNITITVTFSTTRWTATYSTSSANVGINNNVVTINSRGDGTATVAISAMVAQAFVDGQPYGSFADALSAAATAGTATIALAADATVGNAAIAAGKDITIDLAGHDITGAADAAAVFSVADGGTLTITNSTSDVGIVSKGDATACISNAGTLNLQAGKFDIANGAISGGTINVTGGAFNAATFADATLPEGMELKADTGATDAYVYVLGVDNSVARIAGGAKYDTLADAITNATAGATVIVLKNCEVTAPIVIENGIILTNDYTISINANYALRLANGTTTPVTICGTGSIVWNGGSGSPILVGNNEATAKESYGISGIYAGSIVLDSGTICTGTASGGNMIKVENGSFVMNGGTISGNPSRCVKADAENGDTTATVTINGGVINQTDSSKKAIEAAAAGNGTATATINAGDITGKLVGLTIPGTSVARFGSDWTSICATGYKTVLSDGWYVVAPMEYYTAISLNKASTSLVTNETETLTATLTPASAADDSVTWTSSDDTVATVEGGVVTAVGAGTATITAATKNYSATCTVTVTAPAPAGADWVADSSTIPAGTSAADQYPQFAGTALATADAKKLTDWAKANSVTFVAAGAPTDTIVEAYLLNCAATAEAVTAEKAAFKLNITVNGSTVTVSLPDGKNYNGTLQMKGSNDLSTWTNVESASSSYKFYKYSLSL